MSDPGITIGVVATPGDPQLGTVINGVLEVVRAQSGRVVNIGAPIATMGLPLPSSAHIDGWIVVHWPDGLPELAATGVPLVAVNVDADTLGCPVVLPDNRGGVAHAIRHLIQLGHQRIAFMGNMIHKDVRERYAGYADALAEHNLELDPRLVFDLGPGDEVLSTRAALQQLHRAGMPCTAIFPTHDYNAQRIITEAQRLGYRVPEDLAIVGFDDIDSSQFFVPPLTTVRQQFVEHGRVAARLLIAQINGQRPVPGPVYIPTALVVRHSCGTVADMLPSLPPDLALPTSSAGQTALALELLQVLLHPLAVDQQQSPEAIWPGVLAICSGLVAAAESPEPLHPDQYDRGWREACRISSSMVNLLSVVDVLGKAGDLFAATHPQPQAQSQIEYFVRQCRARLLWHYHMAVTSGSTAAMQVAEVYQWALTAMLNTPVGQIADLAWLDQTNEVWGCFACWEREDMHPDATMMVRGSFARDAQYRAPIGARVQARNFPPPEWLPPSVASSEQIVKLLPVRTARHRWGILAVCGMIEPNLYSPTLADILANILDREALLHELAIQQETLQSAYDRERMLSDTVRDLGSPVIPLMRGILLVPLVGTIDSTRAQQVLERVLGSINTERADTVLLDMTGVPLVDTQIASALIQTAQAAMLLGAEAVLVGIRPEIAQSIIGLGINLGKIRSFATLASALASITQERRTRTALRG